MTMETAELGLRERKRLATRRAIQFAAVSLVAENGLDRLTVDEIGRSADISPRTFFNYFPTKEAALIGDSPTLPDEQFILDFVEDDGPLLDALARLFTEAVDRAAEDRELTQLRRSVIKKHPQLFAMRISSMHDFQRDIEGVILRRLQHENPAADQAALASRANLITHVAVGAMRHAWLHWSNDGSGGDLSARLRESFAMLENLLASPGHK
jgi:AcrR family transcriptional regulator